MVRRSTGCQLPGLCHLYSELAHRTAPVGVAATLGGWQPLREGWQPLREGWQPLREGGSQCREGGSQCREWWQSLWEGGSHLGRGGSHLGRGGSQCRESRSDTIVGCVSGEYHDVRMYFSSIHVCVRDMYAYVTLSGQRV